MRRIMVGLSAALLMASLAVPAAASQPSTGDEALDDTGHKVTICHRTSSETKPWVLVTVDVASTGGRNKLMNHVSHEHKGGFDLIPAFSYLDKKLGVTSFAGQGDEELAFTLGCGPEVRTN